MRQEDKGREEMNVFECIFENCSNPGPYSGLCKGHHRQKLAGIDLKPLRPYKPRSVVHEKKNCAFEGCDRDNYRGNIIYCRSHQEMHVKGTELRPLRKYTKNNA